MKDFIGVVFMYLSEKEFKKLCKKLNIDSKEIIKKYNSRKSESEFDSLAEENFYNFYLYQYIKNGFITEYSLHNEFVVLDAIPEYKLRKKVFKPDFLITTKNKETFVIEMKGKVVKKLQRDYGLRKHIFISKYCIPNNWKFIELKSEEWTQNPIGSAQNNIINFDGDKNG